MFSGSQVSPGRVSSAWVQLLVLAAGLASAHLEEATEDIDASSAYKLPLGVDLKDGDTFEYIVVGAGAAGSAAAARLALRGHSVLLVEGGGDPGRLSEIPGAAMALLGSSVDWRYPTLPNGRSCLASRGRACRLSAGRCLGGSTSINHMIYTRGNRQDYDFGIPGWTWKDLKPYFLRYEGLQILDKLPRSSIPYHNTSGLLKSEFFADSPNEWHSRIYDGYRQLGFPENKDVNGISQIGVSRVYGYVYGGERMSTARAYLAREDVQRRLAVATDTLCTGVIIDEGKVARGVTLLPEGAAEPLRVYATEEVILSAGTVGTPHILMLSGVGPAAHLREMGVPVRVDLPVGDNLSDHVLPLMVIQVEEGAAATGGASLAAVAVSDVSVFANTACYHPGRRRLHHASSNCSRPTLQVIHAYLTKNVIRAAQAVFQQSVNLEESIVEQLAEANVANSFVICSPVVLSPFSRGHVRLASADPSRPPDIFPDYLADERDLHQMMRSLRILQHLVETPEFKKRNASLLRLELPGCGAEEEEGYWRCYMRHMTSPGYHAVGTCSLGPVLDPQLRVRGVRRLRVADASVLPRLPRGNTEAATVALGERVVDLITMTPP